MTPHAAGEARDHARIPDSGRIEVRSSVRFVLTLVGVAALAGLLGALLYAAGETLLLGFAGIILAVFLHGVAERIARFTHLSYGLSLTILLLSIGVALGGGGWLLGSSIAKQAEKLREEWPRLVHEVDSRLQQMPWGPKLVERTQQAGREVSTGSAVAAAGTVLSTTTDTAIKVLLVLLVGIYGASKPEVYIGGATLLVPSSHRPRVRRALKAAGYALFRWTLCCLISMTSVGLETGIGMSLLGIPLAPTLGVLAGLFKLVPYIGPWVAFLPIILFASLQGQTAILSAAGLYFVIIMIDDYVTLPLLQWGAVSLPPALAIFSQILFHVLWGVVGLIIAMPLALTLMVLIRVLYVHDTLGEPVDIPGEKANDSPAEKLAQQPA